MVLSEKLSKNRLDMEQRKFVSKSSYLETQVYLKHLPMTKGMKIKIIDTMEKLECDTLLQKFLIDLGEK